MIYYFCGDRILGNLGHSSGGACAGSHNKKVDLLAFRTYVLRALYSAEFGSLP